ncbi:MAG: MFS transporter [Nocardioides sp.]|nr:MFS transporter [Nocardioides sp.]
MFLGNTLNFYDRALTSALLEPIKDAYDLTDTEVGIVASAFVLFAAGAAIPLGRLADRVPRRSVAGWGLLAWSLCTGVGGLAVSFWSSSPRGSGSASARPATRRPPAR